MFMDIKEHMPAKEKMGQYKKEPHGTLRVEKFSWIGLIANQTQQEKKKIKELEDLAITQRIMMGKIEHHLGDLQGNIKWSNIHIFGVPEERRQRGARNNI